MISVEVLSEYSKLRILKFSKLEKMVRYNFDESTDRIREEHGNYCNEVNEYTTSQVLILSEGNYGHRKYRKVSIELTDLGDRTTTNSSSQADNRSDEEEIFFIDVNNIKRVVYVVVIILLIAGCGLAVAYLDILPESGQI